MSFCDYDSMPSVFRWQQINRAKKKHFCCECGTAIHPGEAHGYGFGVWSGDASSFRQHRDCEAACVYVRDKMRDGECLCFGELFEYLGEVGHLRKSDPAESGLRKIMARVWSRIRKERKLKKQERIK